MTRGSRFDWLDFDWLILQQHSVGKKHVSEGAM